MHACRAARPTTSDTLLRRHVTGVELSLVILQIPPQNHTLQPPGHTPPRQPPEKKQSRKSSNKNALDHQLSLFRPQSSITPPETPIEDQSEDPFSNEDGVRIGVLPVSAGAPADRGSPTWGARRDQPKSRASSPPPVHLDDDEHVNQKARELGRQGFTQPRTAFRSESHDRVFATANWRIVNADQGNGGLRNAAEAAAREGKLGDYTWVGTLGMPTMPWKGLSRKMT